MIGDKIIDIEMGRQVGATTLLVRTGYGAQVAEQMAVTCDYIVDDLMGAATVIEHLLKNADTRSNRNGKSKI